MLRRLALTLVSILAAIPAVAEVHEDSGAGILP